MELEYRKREKKIVSGLNNKSWVFYAASFINALSTGVVGPLIIVYLLSIKFSPIQIGILLAGERITTIIAEFPTGVFADRYGRKKSLLVSFFLLSLLLVVWFFSKNFATLFILSIIWGVAYTFQSGAKESLMIDNLNLEKDDKSRDKVFTKISVFGNAGFLVGGLAAAFLTFFSIRYIWLAAAFLNAMLFLLFFTFTKEGQYFNYPKIKNRIKEIKNTMKNYLGFAFKVKPITLLLGVTLFFGLAVSVYDFSFPILFKQTINIPDYYFGFLGSISALAGILGALLAERLTKKGGYYFTLKVFSLVLLMLFIIFGFSKIFWLAVIIYTIIELIINGWFPIYQSFFNKFTPDKMRAGILSVNSSASLISIALGELLAGLMLTIITPNTLILISGFLFIFIPILLIKIRKIQEIKPAVN